MSVQHLVIVRCDRITGPSGQGCPSSFVAFTATVASAEHQAARVGWKHRNGRHTCPHHARTTTIPVAGGPPV